MTCSSGWRPSRRRARVGWMRLPHTGALDRLARFADLHPVPILEQLVAVELWTTSTRPSRTAWRDFGFNAMCSSTAHAGTASPCEIPREVSSAGLTSASRSLRHSRPA